MRMTFELNSAQLTPEAQAQADIFAKVLKESTSAGAFLIEGHTDSLGSRAANLDLSRRRAQTVVAHLVERGVPESKLKAVGFGFDRPRDGLPASNPENRRVEIVRN
jgi:outer membrane protein OmpA-like peptidoglycan-associated protein